MGNVIVIALVALACYFALRSTIRRQKSGGCSCGCEGCTGCGPGGQGSCSSGGRNAKGSGGSGKTGPDASQGAK